ncbi:MAG: hypothetical protein L0Z52_08625, partial [Acidobacteria bacterium]|nr:hypothetical protein [Acidobacteriota bacterium]
MCLWCEVEERVYHSYRDQERKALETIRKVEEECQGESPDGDECSDRRHCIWEKKLEYVVARMLRERLAVEMSDAELCTGEEDSKTQALPRRFPAPTVPAHLLAAFERTIETLFDRLTRPNKPVAP